MIPATQLRVGMIIKYKDGMFRVNSMLRQAMGRGAGKVVVKMKNIKSGANVEQRFRSTETLEPVRIEAHDLEYLYSSGTEHCFMYTDTYEQINLNDDLLSEIKEFLLENVKYTVDFYEGNPIGILPPRTMELKVVETEPVLKGATASSSMKPARLETGLVVGVPPFIEAGTVIKIDTSDKKYVERV